MKIRQSRIPVAGLGTRVCPPPRRCEGNADHRRQALIQYVVDEAKEAGIEHFIFVTAATRV